MMNQTVEQTIAKGLLDIKAVSLSPTEPFTWASGIKSPIYCDNRLTMSYPEFRTQIAKELAKKIKAAFPDVQMIAGTATAGIPHAAFIAQELELPMSYIRSKPKGHGKTKQVEGKLEVGTKVVVIEDLISTGGSVLEACKAARNEGADVLGVAAIFTYELTQATTRFDEAHCPLITLTDYTTLIEVAKEYQQITSQEHALLETFKQDPEHWNKSGELK
ncbi:MULTISPECIES: orotate phosphoribosyltransferase [Enterococcus]|uniref:Orotate phosphoribosyltransferase n=1 Tax=Enterococcus sulfureus ATCC 49903 TaxID=1140003 RepID=S0L5Q1_9ENTE|nr:orotate phosphoribosyltransferase [Enterococcus sulfureus]EOT47643.1 orotate phosphoribosyltransferase [Enterococcus sulfureus ATCC 49903]EOT83936.1 orotate phosphoribosyltransferase [Enterococcus sulfureus ATCC 49903]